MHRDYPQLLVADQKGKIYELDWLQAACMKAGCLFKFDRADLIKLPATSTLFMLPQRSPIAYERKTGSFVGINFDPFSKNKRRLFAVSAFLPPGYTLTCNCAYKELKGSRALPLFAYAPVAFYKGGLYTPAVRVDREMRQDERCMDIKDIRSGIAKAGRILKKNRLFKHLIDCALINNCPAAKNLFLNRYEAPLPASPFCNARCLGCISFQPDKFCPITQPRIRFVPTPDEIAQVAIYHLENTLDPVVSFGQGCEGEPLLVGAIIEKAIKLIRGETRKGIINLNTNASKPEIISRLFDAGLNSMRVSINSVQENYYNKYYRPRDYSFKEVVLSIKKAKERRGFVSINYLTMPGFSDSKEEFSAFKKFLAHQKIDMIQWRNLNFDAKAYFKLLEVSPEPASMSGVKKVIESIRLIFPNIMSGYFNPSRARIARFKPRQK